MLQFHTWTYTDPYWLDALLFLKDFKEEGLIKNIGVTNFDAIIQELHAPQIFQL